MAGQVVTETVMAKPAGLAQFQLMIAGIGMTFNPNVGETSFPTDVCPGAGALVTPPAGWVAILADGELPYGDLGSGNECDRLAVFAKVAGAVEPASYTFSWAPHLAATASFIKAFTPSVVGVPPVVNVAAVAPTITTGVGNPLAVVAPSISPTAPASMLLCIYLARVFGLGVPFSTPPGMMSPDFAFDPNNVLCGNAAPLDIGLFLQVLAAAGATGTRTSQVTTIAPVGGLPFKGLGYSLALSGGGSAGDDSGPLEIYVRTKLAPA